MTATDFRGKEWTHAYGNMWSSTSKREQVYDVNENPRDPKSRFVPVQGFSYTLRNGNDIRWA
jgi:hypothetical protein